MSADAPATTDAETAAAPKAKAAKPKATAKPSKKPGAKKAPKAVKKPAAKKKAAAGDVNKSEEIRKLATAMKAKGTKPRPSVIVAELGAKGIKVAAAQVSFILKTMGFRPLRKRKKKGAAAGAAAGAPKAVAGKIGPRAAVGAVSIDDLLAAKKAVVTLGGSERALEAIQALKRLEG